MVVTTDALIAGVHFFPGEDPSAVGLEGAWRSTFPTSSPRAPTPLAYLMSIALPAAPDRAWLAKFAAGLRAAQEAFGCHLAGGDTDRTPGPLSVVDHRLR